MSQLFGRFVLSLAIALLAGLWGVETIEAHGVRAGTMHHELIIRGSQSEINLFSEIDIPHHLVGRLRQQLDTDNDGTVSPAETAAIVSSLFGRSDRAIQLKLDGKSIMLSTLYEPKLKLPAKADGEGRAALELSWFATLPKGISARATMDVEDMLWNEVEASCHIKVDSSPSIELRRHGDPELHFHENQSRQFTIECSFATPMKQDAKSNPTVVVTEIESAEQAGNQPIQFAAAHLLTESLSLHYRYMFPLELQNRIDVIHRGLRQAAELQRRATTDQSRRQASGVRQTHLRSLLDLLNQSDSVVDVDLRNDRKLQEPEEAMQLPGDAGAVLLKIQRSGSGFRAFKTDYSFSIAEFIPPLKIEPLGSGTTWALLELSQLPNNPTRLKVELPVTPERSELFSFRVQPPQPARLRIKILADDTGEPAPAMVRLTWLKCNLDRRPSTAVDIVDQFNGQGKQTSQRPTNLPAELSGNFWCVSEPFDMVVPPGEWSIAIRRGAEHTAIFDTLSLRSGETLDKVYRPKRWIDMPAKRWYSGDDHVHCQILSEADADRLMNYVRAEDIYLANVVKMGDIHRTFFEQRGFGPDYRVTSGTHVLSPGQECPRTHQQLGHTLAMNTTSMVRDTGKYYLYDTVFDAVHKQGGLSGYAHVNRDLFFVHRDMSLNIPRHKVDFAEILQFGKLGTDLYYDFLNMGFQLTASAGSDVPWGGTIGEVRMYAKIPGGEFSADAWFDAVGQGNTFVTNGPMIDMSVDGKLPGDVLKVSGSEKVHLNARLDYDLQRGGVALLELVSHGKVIAKSEVGSEATSHLQLSLDVEVAGGTWLAIRGTSVDGSVAHTTPVYVVQEGLRFWDYDQVGVLTKRRLANLDEIVHLVETATKQVAAGVSPEQTELIEMAKQGPELMKRVGIAREIYSDLLEVHQREKALREE